MNERPAKHPTPAQSFLLFRQQAGWAGRGEDGIETLLASYQVKPEHKREQKPLLTEGLTGAEIEAVFNEAMFVGFERSKEPTDLDIAGVLSGFAPLSKLMAEQIAALKSLAANRARPATSTPDAEERKLRKLGV